MSNNTYGFSFDKISHYKNDSTRTRSGKREKDYLFWLDYLETILLTN
jgi:hypothetical protein